MVYAGLWNMILKPVTRLRLALSFAAGMTLFGMQSTSAGLLLTIEALTNFQFDGAQVVYDPGLGNLKIKSQGDFRISTKLGGTNSNSGEDTLYLGSNPIDSSGNDGWMVSVLSELNSASEASTSTLLKGSLDSMRVDGRVGGAFDFLVKEGTVSGDLASQFGGAGVYARVAGLDDTQWMAISKSLNQLREDRRNARLILAQSGSGPAIPVPGTILLLVFGAVPLLTSRRRRSRRPFLSGAIRLPGGLRFALDSLQIQTRSDLCRQFCFDHAKNRVRDDLRFAGG